MSLRAFLKFPLLSWSIATACHAQSDLAARDVEFFEKKIRPVLAESCYECHNSLDKKKGGIALDYRGAMRDARVIVPGQPEASRLIQALRHAPGYEKMPANAPKLANVILKNFEEWVRRGAKDPRVSKPTKAELESQVDWDAVRATRAQWWAFRPLREAQPSAASEPEWNQTAIDRFLFHAMTVRHGLEPQPPADSGTLVRRLHLILTGLPPTPETVAQFVRDPSEVAYEKLVDDLIASKRYAERWGRYWLDWFRYAESHGSEGDPSIPYATQYRDYVIRAIHADVPYDQLLREHLAGDLLEEPRVNEPLGLNESAIGTGHLRMVPHGFGVTDAYDEQITFTDNQIDVISKATMGLTISCARCHNHKFDPISQKDYYKFYGMMISSRPAILNVDSPRLQARHAREMRAIKEELRDAFSAHWLSELDGAIQRLDESQLGKVELTDPLGAWASLSERQPAETTRELARLRTRYEEAIRFNQRTKKNATYYADLRDPETYARWFKSGNGLSDAISPAGSFALAGEGERAFTGIYPAGIYTHLLSDKHSGFLNSVFHRASGERNMIRAIGSGSTVRFMVRSYPIEHGGLHPAPRLKPKRTWVHLNKYKYWNGEKGYYQINTGLDRTFKAGGPARTWFGVYEVYAGAEGMRELGAPIVAFPGAIERVRDRASLLAFYRANLKTALIAWRERAMSDDQAALLDAFVQRGFLTQRLNALPSELAARVQAYRELENAIRVPARAPGVVDGEPWDQPFLERGNYKEERDPVPRGFLEVFGGRTYDARSSGRRELVEDLLSERNTLVARVLVNRLWHHVFGRGIVATTDNFGRLGSEPTHPELLDLLALELRRGGWSMKRIVKQLVMSRAFRSVSVAPRVALERDPDNEFLSYYTPRRLDAEAILDTIRFVSKNGIEESRRAVYLRAKRNSLHPFLSAFNYPIPTTTTGVRDLTDVPAQSLTLMNGETVRAAAREWSGRVKRDRSLASDRQRIDAMFLQAYARQPTPEEVHACFAYLKGQVVDETPALKEERDQAVWELERQKGRREALIAPVLAKLQAEVDERNARTLMSEEKPVDLKPIGRWDFDGDARDRVGRMDGTVRGDAEIKDGVLVLRGGCVMTAPLARPLRAKTLEVLVQLDSIEQRAGGAMVVQTTDGHVFDGIVYAEVDDRTWLSGSDHHRRTDRFHAPRETEAHERPVWIAIVYDEDGTTSAYRNGEPYGRPYKRGSVAFEAGTSQVIFGLRHGTGPTSGRHLKGRIHEARLYDRALSGEEIKASVSGKLIEVVTEDMLMAALSDAQRDQLDRRDRAIAKQQANVSRLEGDLAAQIRARDATGDAYDRLAHAILNSKELIYVY